MPVSFKDTTETAGIRTTYGSRIYEHNVPSEDAIVVERARRAGAIVIGKTNTPEFACRGTTDNPLFVQILDSLRVVFDSFFTNPLEQPGFAARSFPFHRQLYEAIRDRDPARARALVDAILDVVEEDLRTAQHAPPP